MKNKAEDEVSWTVMKALAFQEQVKWLAKSHFYAQHNAMPVESLQADINALTDLT